MLHFRKAEGYGHNHKILKQDDEEPQEIPDIQLEEQIADEQPDSDDWKKLHEVADTSNKRIKATVLEAAARTKEEIVLSDLSKAIDREDVSKAQAAINWENYTVELEKLESQITQTVEVAGKSMILKLPENLRGFQFNVNNPKTIKWITEHSAELITNLSGRSKRAVNNVILDSYLRGLHPDKAAKHIENIVGLTGRQSKAVDNYLANAINEGVNEQLALERSQDYANKLLSHRAENIARTESMSAVNRGYNDTIQQGMDQGVIPSTTIRTWVTTPDDRLCEFCRPLNGETAKMKELFPDTGLGRVEMPPLHPSCRCTISFRVLEEGETF